MSALLLGQQEELPRPTSSGPAIVEPGHAYHGDEVLVTSGDGWLALTGSGDSFRLLSVSVRVDTVPDPLGNDAPDNLTGKGITVLGVAADTDVRLLARDIPGLGPGPVATASTGFDLQYDKSYPLVLGGSSYTLQVKPLPAAADRANAKADPYQMRAQLVLQHGDRTQELYALPEGGNDPYWRVLWAGDLDHDGKLDLYLQLTGHYNVSERRLFLSRPAAGKDLVREVAEWIISGC